jgi:hypothetical protein
MRRVLLVSFHFPPVQGSSGVQRTLRFAQHLPAFGWQPIVLTVTPRAYEATASARGNEIPSSLKVHRAFGLDAARHLSLFGRYPRRLALPDRWAAWRYDAIRAGMRIIGSEGIDVVWSTFPIATAHEIGLALARKSSLPWIAEFRDPMWQGDYPSDPAVNRYWLELEQRIFARANSVVMTTPSARDQYIERYPERGADQLALIENGYDEETFARVAVDAPRPGRRNDGPLHLLHSGIIYPSERDPRHFFKALGRLKSVGLIGSGSLRITLRASTNEIEYQTALDRLNIADIVKLEPGIGYLPALEEMLNADGLLILQASNCNAQIPAKLYEYLRADRPILALTDPAGDTARTLDRIGAGTVVPLDSVDGICRALPTFLDTIRRATWRRPSRADVAAYDRKSQAGVLAGMLTALT